MLSCLLGFLPVSLPAFGKGLFAGKRTLGIKRFRTALPVALVMFGTIAFTPAAPAQTTTAGKVVGTVSDTSGGLVAKAEVQIQNVDTGTALNALSNESGGFNFPIVNAGKYRVTVKMAGFRTAVVNDITVDVEKTSADRKSVV